MAKYYWAGNVRGDDSTVHIVLPDGTNVSQHTEFELTKDQHDALADRFVLEEVKGGSASAETKDTKGGAPDAPKT